MSSVTDPYAFELSQEEEKKTETKKKAQAPAKRGRKATAKTKTPSKPQATKASSSDKDTNEKKSSRSASSKSRPASPKSPDSSSESEQEEQESRESQEQSSFDASSASLEDDYEVKIVDAPAPAPAARSTRSTRSAPSEEKVSPARRSSARHTESAPHAHDSCAQVSPHQSSRKRARTEQEPSRRHSSPHKPSAAASSTSGLFAPRFARDSNAHHSLASRTVLDELVLRFLMLGGKLSSPGRKSIDLKGCRTVPDLLDRYSFDELTPYLELHVILNPHLEKEVSELTFEQKLKAVSDGSECKTVSELMDGLVKRYLLIGGDGGRELTAVGRSIRESTTLRALLEQQNIEDLLPLMSIHAHIHPELGQEAALMSITDKLYYFCADT